MKKIHLKAVIIGTVADLLATFLFGIILFFLFGQGGDKALPYALLTGLACIVLGGYVAASIAPNYKIFNATMIGVVGILIGIPFIGSYPIWYSALSIILMPPAAYLGGIIKLKI
ncbi:MAG: hypothetical protein ABIK92_16395 [Pseudomonadota bacterium]